MFRNFLIIVLILVAVIGLDYFIRAHSFISPALVSSLHPTLHSATTIK